MLHIFHLLEKVNYGVGVDLIEIFDWLRMSVLVVVVVRLRSVRSSFSILRNRKLK